MTPSLTTLSGSAFLSSISRSQYTGATEAAIAVEQSNVVAIATVRIIANIFFIKKSFLN